MAEIAANFPNFAPLFYSTVQHAAYALATTDSTNNDTTPANPPSGGGGASSFGSTKAIFLTTVFDIWINLIIWCMITVAAVFFAASVHGVRVTSDKNTNKFGAIGITLLSLVFGGFIGFIQGTIPAALIAAIAVSIPYSVGIDIAAGLGIGQAIIIVYFHLGRADFIHR
jgi:hypothetical protein